MDLESSTSPTYSESEDQPISDDQQKAMMALDNRSGGSTTNTDPNLPSFAVETLKTRELDPAERIQRANESLAAEPEPSGSRGGRHIKFKEDLIDFEAPPDEEPPSQDDDVSRASEEEDKREEDKENSKDADKVLIEKEGKFELVDSDDLKGQERSKSQGQTPLEDLLGLSPQTQEQQRPSSAAADIGNRSSSATEKKQEDKKQEQRSTFVPRSRPQTGNDQKLNRGHRSEEMVREAREAARKKREEDEEKKRRQEEEEKEKKKENMEAFEAWCREKEKQWKERQRQQRELEKSSRERKEDEDRDPDYFKKWCEAKTEQEKKEKLLEKYRREEEQQWFKQRTQADCNRAFRKWCRAKKRQEAEQNQGLGKRRGAATATNGGRKGGRKSGQTAQSIKMAEQFRFIDNYGYRF